MSDNLTQKLKRELEKRGQVASDAQIEEAIALYRQRKTTPSLTSFEGIQTAEPETNNLDLLNAVGVGLYTALDTATFGATGLVLDKTGVDLEDIGLDLEQEGIAATIARAGGGFAGFVVTELRDHKSGGYKNFLSDTISCFEDAGYTFYNDIIIAQTTGTKALVAQKLWDNNRKITRRHQNFLVFIKGDGKLAKQDMTEIEKIDLTNNNSTKIWHM